MVKWQNISPDVFLIANDGVWGVGAKSTRSKVLKKTSERVGFWGFIH